MRHRSCATTRSPDRPAPTATGSASSARQYGAASGYLHTRLRAGDRLEVAAPRGTFTLRPGDSPVLLLSAGRRRDARARHAARPRGRPLRARGLVAPRRPQRLRALVRRGGPLARSRACRTRTGTSASAAPAPATRATTSRRRGACRRRSSAALGLPPDAEAYLCGPPAFMQEVVGRARRPRARRLHRIHTELFGAAPSLTPGIASEAPRPPHPPAGAPGSGPAGRLRPQRPLACAGARLRQPARAGGGLRRARALVVPHRRLPQLRDGRRLRRRPVLARPRRGAGRRQRADLLLAAAGRPRPRPVSG